MEQEAAFLRALEWVQALRFEKDRLDLLGALRGLAATNRRAPGGCMRECLQKGVRSRFRGQEWGGKQRGPGKQAAGGKARNRRFLPGSVRSNDERSRPAGASTIRNTRKGIRAEWRELKGDFQGSPLFQVHDAVPDAEPPSPAAIAVESASAPQEILIKHATERLGFPSRTPRWSADCPIPTPHPIVLNLVPFGSGPRRSGCVELFKPCRSLLRSSAVHNCMMKDGAVIC